METGANPSEEDVANLQALCASCHAMKSAAEALWRAGKRKADALDVYTYTAQPSNLIERPAAAASP